MSAYAVLLALASAAGAQRPACLYLDATQSPPRPTPVGCPGETRYPDPLPPAPLGTVWLQKEGTREYWSEILLIDRGDGRPAPAYPPPPGGTWPLVLVRMTRGSWLKANPSPADLLTRGLIEAQLGRADWAHSWARQGLRFRPDDPSLRALAARTQGADDPHVAMREADLAFENGHRALEHGEPQDALAWLDHSLSLRPTAQAYFLRSKLRRALGKDDLALADAEAGLAIAPHDLMLQSAREDAQRALGASRPAAPAAAPLPPAAGSAPGMPVATALPASREPPLQAPAPALPREDVDRTAGVPKPLLYFILAVLVVGAQLGFWLASRRAEKAARRTTTSMLETVLEPGAPSGAPATPAQPAGLPSVRRYSIRRKIGAGGMGLVFEGVDQSLGRRVAIKQMRDEIKNQERERAEFLREAQIISHLSHPYIVSIHEVVEENGEIFIVFDYVDGKPLSQILAEEKRLPLPRVKKVFAQVCEAVASAHRAHVLHRDLKPANIMVDAQGYAKVMDFGIAREAKDTITRLTRADASGTPAYMAPEQHLGHCAKTSDIYALGICLYEALTGQLPFPGPDFLAQKERMKYPPPQYLAPELPKEAELLFAAALAVDPKQRVADADELAASLTALG